MLKHEGAVALKRAADILFSLTGMIIAAVPVILIGMAIRIESEGPALFVQWRPGLRGKPFRMVKLRTMRAAVAGESPDKTDDARLTRLGRRLRQWSLDEIPELWNVVKGEMSLVGPRPLLMEYLELYTPEQARRHNVRPGITGYVQVKGRNTLTWDEKFGLDIWYVDHWSLKLDLWILAETVIRVIRREGITQPGHATMPKYRGTGVQNG